MKKQELVKIEPLSVFKVGFVTTVLVILYFIFGLFTILIGLATQEWEAVAMGIVFLIISIITPFIAGAIYMLMAWIFNLIAGKFGGIVYYTRDLDDDKIN